MNDFPDCSDIDTTDAPSEACWLKKEKGNYMICDFGGESACSFFTANGGLNNYLSGYYYSDWYSAGANNVIYQTKAQINVNTDYNCTATTTLIFGCNPNYYATNYMGDVVTMCAPCPENGHSPTGNKSITNCYIPKNTSCDDDKGQCTYIENCYY